VAQTIPPPPTAFPPIEVGSDGRPTFSPVWLQWFINLAQVSQNSSQGPTNPVVIPTVGASPATIQNTSAYGWGVHITGGTGLTITQTRDGATFYPCNTTGFVTVLSSGDRLRVVYTAAPSFAMFPL
jgi:hypothetical protein